MRWRDGYTWGSIGIVAVAVVGCVIVLLLASCAAPTELHGRPAFDRWTAQNTVIIHTPIDIPLGDGETLTASGLAIPPDPADAGPPYTILLDDARITANFPPEYAAWIPEHEIGHAIRYAADPDACDLCIEAEMFANCVAQLVTGRPDPAPDPDRGYIICTDAQMDDARLAMIAVGAW